jgi:hypothetical protein
VKYSRPCYILRVIFCYVTLYLPLLIIALNQQKFLSKKKVQATDDGSASGATFKALHGNDISQQPNNSESTLPPTLISPREKKGMWDLSDVILSAAANPMMERKRPRINQQLTLQERQPSMHAEDVEEEEPHPMDMTLDQRQEAMRRNIRGMRSLVLWELLMLSTYILSLMKSTICLTFLTELLESAKEYVKNSGIRCKIIPNTAIYTLCMTNILLVRILNKSPPCRKKNHLLNNK